MAKYEKQVALKRVYEPAEVEDGTRVLVDRLWPVPGTSDICLYTRCLHQLDCLLLSRFLCVLRAIQTGT
jgi:Inactive DUF488-N3 subclade